MFLFNQTLIYLSILSSQSHSPYLCLFATSSVPLKTNVFNSHFSYSFSNFLYSNRPLNTFTKLQNLELSHILNTAISFESDDDPKIIRNRNITDTKSYDKNDDFSNLMILGCMFKKCSSKQNGAGLQVIAPMSVLIHNTIFSHCVAKNNKARGAAIYIVKEPGQGDVNLDDKMTPKLDVQYCCFQECYGTSDFQFGACIFSASENTTLFYSSSVQCSGEGYRSNGAQYDLQSHNIVSKSVNITTGYSNYCGGIEYRNAHTGFFIHQTLTNITACFATSFTNIQIENIELSDSNFVDNIITFYKDNETCNMVVPAIIHARNKPIRIINFCFMNNQFLTKYCNDHTGRQPIIPQVVSNQGGQTNEIIMVNCSANIADPIHYNSSYITTKGCDFGVNISSKTIEVSQLNLGECKGNVTAAPIIFSSPFTPSSPFTSSHSFTISGDIAHSSDQDDKSLSTGAIAGIAAGAAVVAAGGAVAAFFIVRHHHIPNLKEPETLGDNAPQMANDNPLYDEAAPDDPFKEDFADRQNI